MMRRAEGIGSLTLRTSPPASVKIRPAKGETIVRQTPVLDLSLAAGDYQIELMAEDRILRFPFRITRMEDGQGRSETLNLPLAPKSVKRVVR